MVGTHGVSVPGIFVVTARSLLMVVSSGISRGLSPVGRGRAAWLISTKLSCSTGIVPIPTVPVAAGSPTVPRWVPSAVGALDEAWGTVAALTLLQKRLWVVGSANLSAKRFSGDGESDWLVAGSSG